MKLYIKHYCLSLNVTETLNLFNANANVEHKPPQSDG